VAAKAISAVEAPGTADGCQQQEDVAALERFVAPYRGRGACIHTCILEGDPARQIQDAALDLPADLVVMATHGRGAFEHLVLGSVTEKVLRHATCPVLTLGAKVSTEPSFPMFRRVLCALDLTAASARTLHVALSLAEENMASVTLLHVLEGMSERAGSQQIEDAFDRLRFHVPPETQAFCSVTERVEEGSAWREVLRVAETTDADLIVMGAHPSGLFDWPFFGATLNHVVREAHCPVLVVKDLTARVGARREVSTASALLRHPDAIVF